MNQSALQNIVEAFNRYTQREQIILLAGGFSIALYLLWKLLIVPVAELRQQELSRTAGMALTLAQVQTMASSLKAAPKTEQAKGRGSIAELVDRTLQNNGLRMTGFQPGANGEARLRLDNVTFAGLSQWLYELEFTHGVQVRELSANASNTPGLVMVSVRLRKES